MSDPQGNNLPNPSAPPRRAGFLDLIEWLGNKLPDPAVLFVLGALLVMVASQLAASAGWTVQMKRYRQAFTVVVGADGRPLTHDGVPRVQPLVDEKGAPVLELTSDLRRVRPLFEPGAEFAGSPHGAPLLDEHGAPIVILAGEEKHEPAIAPVSLLTGDGLYWCLSTMVQNFLQFPPLGVVLVAMLGIGVAEKGGMMAAALKMIVLVVPRFLLTPTIIFVGVNSSLATDAGYIVLPPLAAALYASVGRSPLAGIGAAFVGIGGGFNANLLITSLEPMLANFTTSAAQAIDPDYVVAPTCGWWFMIASTFLITFVGWGVSSWVVEPRLRGKPADDGGPPAGRLDGGEGQVGRSWTVGLTAALLFAAFVAVAVVPLALVQSPFFACESAYAWLSGALAGVPGVAPVSAWFGQLAEAGSALAAQRATGSDSIWLNPPLWLKLCIPALAGSTILPWAVFVLACAGMPRIEARGLAWATSAGLGIVGVIVVLALLPGSPLHGIDVSARGVERWIVVIVPLILFAFLAPGVAYGVAVGAVRSPRDVARLMTETMATMAPVLILAFFAGQFIAYFKYSRLDQMVAMQGGQWLASAELPSGALIVIFIAMVAIINLLISSMSAKYSILAPVFVPMLMMTGISPELTQTAYRISDSFTNIITPLNPYLVILLVFAQKYVPKAGIGTLISMMMPYSIALGIAWTALLLLWMQLGWELGIGGPLQYVPSAG